MPAADKTPMETSHGSQTMNVDSIQVNRVAWQKEKGNKRGCVITGNTSVVC